MDLPATLESFFRATAPLDTGEGVVVAFSGGPDSTALLWGMSRLAAHFPLRLHAAHLDHSLDPGSAARAAAAARIAFRFGVPLTLERREVPSLRRRSEGLEAAARRERYGFLEKVRQAQGARWIATAHHLDDQAETVLLRLLFGSGIEGLAGIRPVRGAVVRPLLDVTRATLAEAVAAAMAAAGVEPVDDPTNRDLAQPRSRLRHGVLPALTVEDPQAAERLARIAMRARGAAAALDHRLAAFLEPQPLAGGGVGVRRDAFERLPEVLQPLALAALHRRAGAPYPAGAAARGELLRQLSARRGDSGNSGSAACDCGGGWRWEAAGGLLTLRRGESGRERVADFTYTLEVPGELEIPELAIKVSLSRRPVEPWMFRGSPVRAALALPLEDGDCVTVRNRRPGDRIHPLGASGSRRLKEVLVDRHVPRRRRDRLPLLCVAGHIAWVPGVTIDQRFRLGREAAAWVAEVTSSMSADSTSETAEPEAAKPPRSPADVEVLFDAETVRDRVTALGRQVAAEMDGDDLLLVALLGGSVIFLADLVRAIERPVRFEFINVGYSQEPPSGEEDETGVLAIEYPIPVEISGQSVLVLKDVVSSAVTEPYLEQQLRDHGAREVRFAALIDMPDERKTEFTLHYHALSTRRRGPLVGYGLKHEGRLGNLPFVGRLPFQG